MTGDEAMAKVKAVLAQPRGHGDLQSAVWYSKLMSIEDIVEEWEKPE